MKRGVDQALLEELLGRFGRSRHDACAIDLDPERTSVYAAERDGQDHKTGRILLATYDTQTGAPVEDL